MMAPAPPSAIPDLGKAWFPTVQWGDKFRLPVLHEDEITRTGKPYPVLATTYKSAMPGKRAAHGLGPKPGEPLDYNQDIRERLGGFEGTLMVNGLTKDDLLDEVWDDLDRVMRFCLESRVEIMVTPQFSYYEVMQNCMTLLNTKRIFMFYQRILEEGFPVAVLDCPPSGLPWYRDEYLHFIQRNQVKMIAFSYQTLGMRGGLTPQMLRGAMDWNADLPADVQIMVFGLAQPLAAVQLMKLMEGRKLYFSGSNASAMSAFFSLLLPGQTGYVSAPPGMTKAEVFLRNVRCQEQTFEAAQRMFDPEPEGDGKGRRSQGRRQARARSRERALERGRRG
jgi:hypothetical protein